MTRLEQTKILERFNSKVDQLAQCDFIMNAKGGGARISYQQNKGWDSKHIGPSEVTIDATVLTLRLFLQDNESISLRNMAALYQKLCVSGRLVNKFLKIRQEINNYLNASSGLFSASNNGQMTHRDIFELFIYGNRAHMNKNKVADYESLSQDLLFPLFETDFTRTVAFIILNLKKLQQINLEALNELQ